MKGRGKLGFSHLVVLAFFIVSGGPFGLEELLAAVGATPALLVLVLVPIFWSLPAALLVGELAAALPEEGGFYAWVRRALGPFWGVQEAWWSLASSVFDMAIYPTLFGLYLARLHPALNDHAIALGLFLIAAVLLNNLRGAHSVGDSSLVLFVFVMAPFALIAFLPSAGVTAAPAPSDPKLLGVGLAVAMWNYMGWDNVATFAPEVDRPQRNYPLAVLISLLLIAFVYLVPVWSVARSGVDVSSWTTGSWSTFAGTQVGPALGVFVSFAGAFSAAGMCNALVLSYSRLPLAMAENRELPAVFARKSASGVPFVSLCALAVGYGLALGLGFRRPVALDVVLYGLSLILGIRSANTLVVQDPATCHVMGKQAALADLND